MPELPEVETIKLQLNQVLPNLEIKSINVRTAKVFRGDPQEIIGKKIEKVERRGKMIIIKFKDQRSKIKNKLKTQNLKLKTTTQNLKLKDEKKKALLLIHLKLTGRLIFDIDEYERNKHTHIVMTFTNGKKLYFWDLRKFGWMKIVTNPPAGWAGYELRITSYELGVDPLAKEFTVKRLQELLCKSKKPIKILLMEQEKIAGVGNIYANEALFCARIDPRKKAHTLTKEKADKLFKCLKKVLQKGLKYHGASDDSFRLIDGSKGKMQDHFLVYRKQKENCPHGCGVKIQRITLGGRGTFFCPKCQS